jgi:hypothetical protein
MLKKHTIPLKAITLHLFTSLLNKKLILLICKSLILVYLKAKIQQPHSAFMSLRWRSCIKFVDTPKLNL